MADHRKTDRQRERLLPRGALNSFGEPGDYYRTDTIMASSLRAPNCTSSGKSNGEEEHGLKALPQIHAPGELLVIERSTDATRQAERSRSKEDRLPHGACVDVDGRWPRGLGALMIRHEDDGDGRLPDVFELIGSRQFAAVDVASALRSSVFVCAS